MAFTAGQQITLSGAALYAASDSTKKASTVSGTYYIWSAAEKNGRIRITNSLSNVGKTPAGTYVTGWVDTSAISSTATTTTTTTSNASSTASSAAGTQTITTAATEETSVYPDADVPGQIGYLGRVVFLVTESQIKTLTNFTWSQSASYASHDRHLGRSALEFTGTSADSLSFKFLLSAYLGTAPMTDYITLLGYMRAGTPIPFKLGNKAYGYDRWVITALSYTGQYSDGDGDWTQAQVSVTLSSYERTFAT